MAKVKTAYFCQNCGNQFSKWQGQCTACKEWNTIVEEVIQTPEKNDWKSEVSLVKKISKPLKIDEIDLSQEARLNTKDEEFNRSYNFV